MNIKRRNFIAGIAGIASITALDGFALLKASSAFQSKATESNGEISRDIKDYPHITDVIQSKELGIFFPMIVDACADPKNQYLVKIPFIIELDVCKMWSESRFKWDALSNSGAAGLQQLMEIAAKDFNLPVSNSPELQKLNSAISEYKGIQSDSGSKRQEICTLAESGSEPMSEPTIARINSLRAELGDLDSRKAEAYKALSSAKSEYVAKINALSMKQLKAFDARFVPELSIPSGVSHLAGYILECKEFFGGPVEMNVWRGVAAYNSGLGRTKRMEGFPFIQETVQYTRTVISNLTKMMELKSAYSTKDAELIAKTKSRLRL